MPLTKCPDCGREVSDRAPACPNCGAPIAMASTPTAVPPLSTPKVEIEKTNRGIKQQMIWAVLMAGIGLALMFAGSGAASAVLGTLMFLGGIIWWFVARISGWYKNG